MYYELLEEPDGIGSLSYLHWIYSCVVLRHSAEGIKQMIPTNKYLQSDYFSVYSLLIQDL